MADDQAAVRLPFAEQIAAIRARTKNLIPTAGWTDVMRNGHDRAFVVAGAMKADLLGDFAQAIDKSIADGKSIDWFRKEFDQIVDRHGWSYTGERNWRTRVIYTTNMRTSYATGRLAQLRDPELQAVAPYWMYKHGGSADPRPQHQAWDGLTLKQDDPWWQTHYPPNGWGCSCYVVAVSAQQAERLGGRLASPPDRDPKGAIDKGWDYMPGNTVADELRDTLAHKRSTLPSSLGAALTAESTPVNVRAFAAEAAAVADRKIELDLGEVKNAVLIKQQTGFDLTGYRRVLDNYGVRHTLKKHGNESTEAARGQIAVTLDDFSLIPLITDFPDRVFYDGKNKVGRDALVFVKLVGGVGYRHVAEIREGKELVVTDSMRKKKGDWKS